MLIPVLLVSTADYGGSWYLFAHFVSLNFVEGVLTPLCGESQSPVSSHGLAYLATCVQGAWTRKFDI